MAQEPQPDVATPAWSRDLAEIQRSAYWGDWRDATRMERRDAFLEAAAQYATYDDLPPDLQRVYDAAARQMGKSPTK